MIGEEVSDDSVWITKTHYPMRYSWRDFKTNKIFITVRNPFDIIVSTIHFFGTYTHSKQLENDFAKEDPEFFHKMMLDQVRLQKQFYDHLFKMLKEKKVPIIIVKYEDLMEDPKEQL
jgi:malate/lactate dehydrogenase